MVVSYVVGWMNRELWGIFSENTHDLNISGIFLVYFLKFRDGSGKSIYSNFNCQVPVSYLRNHNVDRIHMYFPLLSLMNTCT